MQDVLDAIVARRLADVERSAHIDVHIAVGRGVGIRDGDQGGEVKYRILFPGDLPAEMRVADVAIHHLDLFQTINVFQPAPMIERIILCQRRHLVATCDQRFDQM